MARPLPRITRDANIEFIDGKSAPRFIHYGTQFKEISLPRGSRVIYPNPPMEALGNVRAAIRHAMNHPEESDPLFAKLFPGMKLTIAMDDISLPLPQMSRPDARELILTEVLKLCADYGVDDIELIVATCLHRRMTGPEIRRMVGDKIFNDYYPERLYNHDGEDMDQIVDLGQTDEGHHVRLNKRAVDSDLLIYVNINLVPMDGGHKSVTVGLCDYKSVSAHHNTRVMHKCHSYMDPRHHKSEMARITDKMGLIVDKHLEVFHIETAINTRMYPSALSHLMKSESTWSEFDWAKFRAGNVILDRLPEVARRKAMEQITAPYGIIAVHAGKTEPTHKKILDISFKQYAVPVKGQADVVIAGAPYISPYNVHAPLNPILVQVMAMGYLFNMYRNMPLVRKDGVMIVYSPMHENFCRVQHPSYVEFYHRILSMGTDSRNIHQYEKEFAENPDYIQMYRKGHAYHPVHPFYMWYWGDAARAHIGKVIVVGAEHARVPRQLGWYNAKSLDEALEMAQGHLNKTDLEVTMFHAPPIMICDMEV